MNRAPRLRVLIADDDSMIREVLAEVLNEEPDIDVVAVARDADEAIRFTERDCPDVAVLDLRMPGGGGARAAREIAARCPATALLAFSAYSDRLAVSELHAIGVAEFLLKGVPNTVLVSTVRRLGRRTTS
jgi:DNA-binding NarL/FixJ family response regulator